MVSEGRRPVASRKTRITTPMPSQTKPSSWAATFALITT